MSRPIVNIIERHPAEPGYYVLAVVPASDDVPADVELHAVLHWGYEKEDQVSIPYPITLGGVNVEGPHILRPDGAIERAEGSDYASLEAFRQALGKGDV